MLKKSKYKWLAACSFAAVLTITGLQSQAAVRDTFTDGDLKYTVLTEAGSTGTVEVAKYGFVSGDITIPDSVKNDEIIYSVTSIGFSAFSGCSSLTSIEIPDSVTVIGDYAFSYSGLTNIEIPDSVTSIGEGAFYGCDQLPPIVFSTGKKILVRYSPFNTETSYTIPDTVTCVADNAFRDCWSLKSITIPNNVIFIGASAFYYCDSLTNIEIPDSVTFIGNNAFGGCTQLPPILFSVEKKILVRYSSSNTETSYTIPDTVTYVANSAFSGCSSLASIEIPNSVTSIGANAFDRCSSLNSVVIPNSVKFIGDNAFAYCSSLSSIELPESVAEIGNSSFSGCSNLSNIVINSDVVAKSSIFSGIRNLKSVTIGNNVTSIGGKAFYDCRGLTNVVTGNNVTSIGDSAFNGCISLTSVVIPDSVSSIGDNAFAYCSSLCSIEIPDSVMSIGSYAFSWNTRLTSVVIGNGVAEIGAGAFSNCTSLTGVYFKGDAPSIDNSEYYDSWNVFYNTLATIYYLKVTSGWTNPWGRCWTVECAGWIIQDEIIYIYQLDGTASVSGYIGENDVAIISEAISAGSVDYNVTSIADNAFSYSGLTSIEIPDSVTSIGERAFYGCDQLPPILFSVGKKILVRYSSSNTETSYTIPDTVTYVADNAFRECRSLASIVIPDSVISIGDNAFRECRGLTSIVIGDSVTFIGDDAFNGCRSLNNVVINSDMVAKSNIFSGIENLKRVTFGNNVTEIGDNAFNRCSSLTSVVIPDSVISIGDSAFSACSHLTSVVIGNSVTEIGDSAFCNCDGLRSVYFRGDAPSLGSNVFRMDPSLIDYHTSATIYYLKGTSGWTDPWGHCPAVEYSGLIIQDGVIYVCQLDGTASVGGYIGEIDAVIIPESISVDSVDYNVTFICDWAFSNCLSLNSVIIPNSMISIGNWVFDECSSLTSITIPDSVTSIGFRAFSGCSSLTSIEIPDSVTSIGSDAFKECSSLTSVTIPDSVTSIGFSAFSGCSSLTSIDIPDSVTVIGDFAFSYSGLTNIDIPDSVTSIGSDAFMGCESLVSVVLPNSVTSIEEDTFLGCSSLTSITIPNSITFIGSCAFYWCEKLTSILIPVSVKYIGEEAFASCTNLESVYIGSNEMEVEGQNDGFDENGIATVRAAADEPGLIIGDRVFQYDDKLKIVRLGENVKTIGSGAFSGCESIEEITIPNSVTEVWDYAFECCTNLEIVNIGANVETIGSGVFFGCERVTEVNIPDSVSILGDSVFEGCSSLTAVDIGNNVDTVGYSAFKDCTNLTTIIMGENVFFIDWSALSGCDNLSTIVFMGEAVPEGVAEALAETYADDITIYHSDTDEWNEAATMIAEITDARMVVSSTDEIAITEANVNGDKVSVEVDKGEKVTFTVIADGLGLFYQWLKDGTPISGATADVYEIELPELSDAGEYSVKVSNLGNSMYSNSLTLQVNPFEGDLMTIGKLIYRIESLDKSQKTGTVSVVGYVGTLSSTLRIENDITLSGYTYDVIAIEPGTFIDCEKLKIVEILGNVESIGDDAFLNCSNLVSIKVTDLNAQYSSVDGVLFNKDQTSLILCPAGYPESIYMVPESVKSIGNRAFAGSINLEKVYYLGEAPRAGDDIYEDQYFLVSYCKPEYADSWAEFIDNGEWQGRPLVCGPAIVTSPESQEVDLGDFVIFSVEVIGTEPLDYQWYKDDSAINGAIYSTYAIASVAADDAGSYTVTVSNEGGSVTSEVAVLTVLVASYHPADGNNDFIIDDMELMDYATRWLFGDPDIPDEYLMWGANIWLNGGTYGYQADLEEPYCWAME